MSLLFALWIPERPSSFRNRADSAWWKKYVRDEVINDQALTAGLLGPQPVKPPSQTALKLEVLHLHSGGTLRDVDNTAKPIMDAFNGWMYEDDKQVRELIFRSLEFDCEAANAALQPNRLFCSFLRSAALQAKNGGHSIDHLTFVAFTEIPLALTKTTEERAAADLLWDDVRGVFK